MLPLLCYPATTLLLVARTDLGNHKLADSLLLLTTNTFDLLSGLSLRVRLSSAQPTASTNPLTISTSFQQNDSRLTMSTLHRQVQWRESSSVGSVETSLWSTFWWVEEKVQEGSVTC